MSSYRAAGVNLEAAEALVDHIAAAVTSTWGPGVRGAFGGFAGGIDLPAGYEHPVLMLSTDGVGTKAHVARQAGLLSGLGQDLVAMCVDDLVAAGARPLAMTDYIATGRIDPERMTALVDSISTACRAAGVALLGGETAEHPGVMADDEFDLAGTALGIAEAASLLDGSTVRPGDHVVALASPNLRANGFSLIRHSVLPHLSLQDEAPGGTGTIAELLLEPSVLYAPIITPLLGRVAIHAMAHVTGGGIAGNLRRVLPAGIGASIDTRSWDPPAVFRLVEEAGEIPRSEMFRTFNMGAGFLIVTPKPDDVLAALDCQAWSAGVVDESDAVAVLGI